MTFFPKTLRIPVTLNLRMAHVIRISDQTLPNAGITFLKFKTKRLRFLVLPEKLEEVSLLFKVVEHIIGAPDQIAKYRAF